MIGGSGGGLEVYVTGDLGLWADFEEVFGEVDTKLLGATVLLVLVLLGAIYRAPLIALIPIVVVALAYQVASGFIYLYADAGNTVNSNATSILVVLMFGVGTDYCLLLVSRYREELHRVEDKHEAMARALRRAGPAVLASGCTVIAAMLVLLLADTGSTNALGPGVGDRRRRRAARRADAAAGAADRRPAPRLLAAQRGGRLPPDVDGASGGRLAALRRPRARSGPASRSAPPSRCSGSSRSGCSPTRRTTRSAASSRRTSRASTASRCSAQSFPQGALGPTSILVLREGGAATDADLAAVRRRSRGSTASPRSEPQRVRGRRDRQDRRHLRDDPYSEAALARVDTLRDRVGELPGGATALVGAGSAVQEDFNVAAERDLRVIVPVALLVIAIILGILLQAIVAPLVLIATVMASFFGTLGLSIFFFIEVSGDRGVDASLPTFAFIFLVALGVDYTIFLMSRVREEARHARDARGRAARAGGHRAGDHQRRAHPRRHVLGADDAAGDVRLQHRLHGRRRHPARHVRRADDHGARDMDMLGHLNQSVYHELLEEARAALFQPLFEGGAGPSSSSAWSSTTDARSAATTAMSTSPRGWRRWAARA